jgi:uncharacterized repeat protein (TIGR01451 family)
VFRATNNILTGTIPESRSIWSNLTLNGNQNVASNVNQNCLDVNQSSYSPSMRTRLNDPSFSFNFTLQQSIANCNTNLSVTKNTNTILAASGDLVTFTINYTNEGNRITGFNTFVYDIPGTGLNIITVLLIQ